MTRHTIVTAALCALTALGLGCQPTNTTSETATTATKASTEAPKADSTTPTQDPAKPGHDNEGPDHTHNNNAPGQDSATTDQLSGPCKDYSDKVCKEVGDSSSTCGAFRQAAALMAPSACTAGLTDFAFTSKAIADMGKLCTQLVDKLCKDIGPETQSCDMVKKVTKTFPPDRCQMMMANYSEVLAELKAEEERNKPLDDEKREAIAAKDAPFFGKADAKVTIVEFSDFQCPYCSQTTKTVSAIKDKYGDKVRFVFRQFPLPFHTEAHLAAQAALEANAQGKFWAYHDLLFANQRALQREDLEKYAKEAGLDMGKFRKALDSKKHAKAVDDDLELGKQVNVRGTPTMFINGTPVTNPNSIETVTAAIDKAL
ncbi:MAG: thioredoxin domain-containing protein [Myxococcota bacterium]